MPGVPADHSQAGGQRHPERVPGWRTEKADPLTFQFTQPNLVPMRELHVLLVCAPELGTRPESAGTRLRAIPHYR
ncbi:hypothetical protein XAP6164_2840001 [Xanthomonas phaseoli pv. phaseoli]|nr:hypothetical protein XAP6164_2840001 [Xanthomonas phaseoli pv. phaseoli]